MRWEKCRGRGAKVGCGGSVWGLMFIPLSIVVSLYDKSLK